MGQIANQMLLEWCHKMAQKIGEKRNLKKQADQDKNRASESTNRGDAKKKTE